MSLRRLIQAALQQAAGLWDRWHAAETITVAPPPPRILARINSFLRKLNLNL